MMALRHLIVFSALLLGPSGHAVEWLGPTVDDHLQRLAGEPVTLWNRTQLYVDGPEFFPIRLEMIRNARHTIDLITFLWCDDEAGMAVAKALADASRDRGVRVRV